MCIVQFECARDNTAPKWFVKNHITISKIKDSYLGLMDSKDNRR